MSHAPPALMDTKTSLLTEGSFAVGTLELQVGGWLSAFREVTGDAKNGEVKFGTL